MINAFWVLGFLTNKKFKPTNNGYICYFQLIMESVIHSKLDGKPKLIKEMLDFTAFDDVCVQRLNRAEIGCMLQVSGCLSQLRRWTQMRTRVPFLLVTRVQKIIPPREKDIPPYETPDMADEVTKGWFPSPALMSEMMDFVRQHPEYGAIRGPDGDEILHDAEDISASPELLKDLAVRIARAQVKEKASSAKRKAELTAIRAASQRSPAVDAHELPDEPPELFRTEDEETGRSPSPPAR